jgi:putative ATPase
VAQLSKCRFVQVSAVTTGVPELKGILEESRKQLATYRQRTILFVDEIHRLNKSQQGFICVSFFSGDLSSFFLSFHSSLCRSSPDVFLPFVESGAVTLVGATTENPSFELNSALLSRCKVGKTNKTHVPTLPHVSSSLSLLPFLLFPLK